MSRSDIENMIKNLRQDIRIMKYDSITSLDEYKDMHEDFVYSITYFLDELEDFLYDIEWEEDFKRFSWYIRW